jgi:hypothetical protein
MLNCIRLKESNCQQFKNAQVNLDVLKQFSVFERLCRGAFSRIAQIEPTETGDIGQITRSAVLCTHMTETARWNFDLSSR